MAKLMLTEPVRYLAGGNGELSVEGETVGDVLRNLVKRFPGSGPKLIRGDGSLSAYLIVYLDGRDIRLLQMEQTPVRKDSEIRLTAAMAGG